MGTKLENLKTKLDKQAESLETLRKQIEDEEMAELQAQEFATKVADLQEQLKPAIVDVIESVGLDFPTGRTVNIGVSRVDDDYTIDVSAIAPKIAKASKSGGGNGHETIEYDGKKMSWGQLADILGIARTPGGSAHRDVLKANKELHDSIPHDCPYV